jgi:hypothetical protein
MMIGGQPMPTGGISVVFSGDERQMPASGRVAVTVNGSDVDDVRIVITRRQPQQ